MGGQLTLRSSLALLGTPPPHLKKKRNIYLKECEFLGNYCSESEATRASHKLQMEPMSIGVFKEAYQCF